MDNSNAASPCGGRAKQGSGGFTLVEMLVVIAILAVLAGLLLPALAKAKQRGRAVSCLNNNRQLILGWRLYAEDHDDVLLASGTGVPGVENWMTGWLDFTPHSDGEQHILDSPLYKYVANPKVYICPEDRSGRPRSFAMNNWMGGPAFKPSGPQWRVYTHLDSIDNPTDKFVFIDEREDSINDGKFVVNMKNYPDPGSQRIVSYPGNYHNDQATVTFADGHADFKEWTDDRTMPEMKSGKLLPSNKLSADNKDVSWLQHHATSRIP